MSKRALSVATSVLRAQVQSATSSADTAREVEQAFARFYALMVDVIGETGFAALFARAMHLTRQRVPWVGLLEPKLGKDLKLGRLCEVLEKEGRAPGIAGTAELLGCLCALLFSLIGEDLTLRLIGRIWAIGDAQATTDSEET